MINGEKEFQFRLLKLKCDIIVELKDQRVKMCFAKVDNQPHSNVHVQFITELIVMSSA